MTSWEAHIRDQDATHEPSDADFLANCGLDAYGRLNWTVGNEDWIACFDAVLSPEKERIAYHVIVDCESGGFTDTVEARVIRTDDENAIRNIECLPDYFADICAEHYVNDDELYPKEEETEDCATRWKAHIADLIKQAKDAA